MCTSTNIECSWNMVAHKHSYKVYNRGRILCAVIVTRNDHGFSIAVHQSAEDT
jgi:hypothetical protein